uniref:Chromo domain-containing protein n=1 Tax=Tanacetum cinerariifolium TaxID=118510 RepID=A0A6L2MXN2_TANCI|nr:hypothetical protein [Tanacetum cinerariifolium]
MIHPVFHVSQLKACHTDNAVMREFPQCDTEGLIVASPLKLLQRKMVKQGNRPVVFSLIQWSNGTEDDATWEPLADLIKRIRIMTLSGWTEDRTEISLVRSGRSGSGRFFGRFGPVLLTLDTKEKEKAVAETSSK